MFLSSLFVDEHRQCVLAARRGPMRVRNADKPLVVSPIVQLSSRGHSLIAIRSIFRCLALMLIVFSQATFQNGHRFVASRRPRASEARAIGSGSVNAEKLHSSATSFEQKGAPPRPALDPAATESRLRLFALGRGRSSS